MHQQWKFGEIQSSYFQDYQGWKVHFPACWTHSDLKLWPFDPKTWCVHPCFQMHQYWKFGESVSKTFQDIVLTTFGTHEQAHKQPENNVSSCTMLAGGTKKWFLLGHGFWFKSQWSQPLPVLYTVCQIKRPNFDTSTNFHNFWQTHTIGNLQKAVYI